MSRLHRIAQDCAPLLKGRWRYLENEAWTEHRNRAVLQDDSRRGRWVILSDYYGGPSRIEVRGSRIGDQLIRHSITVSQTRNAPAIAADINRRFLPQYRTLWAEAEEKHKAELARQERLRLKVALLKKLAPDLRSASTNGGPATDFYLRRGQLRLSPYSEDATLDRFTLSFDQLVRVLQILDEDAGDA